MHNRYPWKVLLKHIPDLRSTIEYAFGKRTQGNDPKLGGSGEFHRSHHQLLSHIFAFEVGIDLGVVDDEPFCTGPRVCHTPGFGAIFFSFKKAFGFAVELSDFHAL